MNQPFHQIRYEEPFTPMFLGCDLRLGIGGLTLDVDHFEITKPRRTWVKEASEPTEREIPDSLAGVIYGHGNVELSRTRGDLEINGEESAIIPHGLFGELSDEERAKYPAAGWKFTFDYTQVPTVHPM